MSIFIDKLLNSNKSFQENVQYNDVALDDTWTIPGLVLGGLGLKSGVSAARGLAPYARDIWAGKELLIHKPFKWMSKDEFKNYNNLGTNYYQNYLQKKPANIQGYGKVTFGRRNRGKDDTLNMEQYPFLRKNLENSVWNRNTNYKNETDRTYDYFRGGNYDYVIENIINKGKRYKMMHKIDE